MVPPPIRRAEAFEPFGDAVSIPPRRPHQALIVPSVSPLNLTTISAYVRRRGASMNPQILGLDSRQPEYLHRSSRRHHQGFRAVGGSGRRIWFPRHPPAVGWKVEHPDRLPDRRVPEYGIHPPGGLRQVDDADSGRREGAVSDRHSSHLIQVEHPLDTARVRARGLCGVGEQIRVRAHEPGIDHGNTGSRVKQRRPVTPGHSRPRNG